MTGGSQEATGTPRDEGSPTGERESADEPRSAVDDTRFAHASEAEMARILDFYQVRWEYEPTTFPILWNLDGDVVESFAPDFYLPDLEVFLEMTTLKQRLVRKKNRKLRRLRELYPGIRIKLFYARDFRAMMLKYGRLGLAESLSGTPGQVVPVRAAARADASALGEPVATEAPPAVDEQPLPADAVAAELGTMTDPQGAVEPRPAPRRRTGRRRRPSGQAVRIAAQAARGTAEQEAGA